MSNTLANLYDTLNKQANVEYVYGQIKNLNIKLSHDPKNLLFGYSHVNEYHTHKGLKDLAQSTYLILADVATKAGVKVAAEPDGEPDSNDQFITWAWDLLGVKNNVSAPKSRSGSRGRNPDSLYYYKQGGRGRRGDRGGHADVREGMTAEKRKEKLPGVSVRSYRRAVRAIAHLQARNNVLREQRNIEFCRRVAKTRLASRINEKDFCADKLTAAFVAYYVARLGRASVFGYGSQERPMDEFAQSLFDACVESETTRWDVISYVYTTKTVLSHLDETHKGLLLGEWFNCMVNAARVCEQLWDPNRARDNMIARRGDNSSAWNAASRAFNQSRTGWLNLINDLGLTSVLEKMLPGKIPALIAADVSYLHKEQAVGKHADEIMFTQLANPWDVVLGKATCTLQDVEKVAELYGMDAKNDGWSAGARQTEIEKTTVTKALVHGVEVSSHLLAAVLKTHGAFSGNIDR